jgi:hypothetical protein
MMMMMNISTAQHSSGDGDSVGTEITLPHWIRQSLSRAWIRKPESLEGVGSYCEWARPSNYKQDAIPKME